MKLSEMTAEEKRVAIAEACGWSRCRPHRLGRSGNQRMVIKGVNPQTSMQRELPDYLSDLNAMHDAEKTLGWDYILFEGRLKTIVRNEWDAKDGADDPPASFHCHATAAQRADAFLIAKGLATP